MHRISLARHTLRFRSQALIARLGRGRHHWLPVIAALLLLSMPVSYRADAADAHPHSILAIIRNPDRAMHHHHLSTDAAAEGAGLRASGAPVHHSPSSQAGVQDLSSLTTSDVPSVSDGSTASGLLDPWTIAPHNSHTTGAATITAVELTGVILDWHGATVTPEPPPPR